MYAVNLCGLPTVIAHAAHSASDILCLVPVAPVVVDLNSHHELRDGHSPSTTTGEGLATTPSGMEIELSDDTAQATRISGVSFPNVNAQRVLHVFHCTSTRLHRLGPPSAIPHCRDGGRHPTTGRHAATTETCRICPA
ncbi:hypothetical protein TcCL_NonESM10428 [Trypanosoma cruzi]|uniref:Uncharacterized protein n=1 Tax=Trypanosoma cruzi (strain CL Brener) TaxID=353153 RepID=Q4CUN4_TRYCC|nr:hypothetical protein Tc00.1047053510701.20 [Trypanosoma cruzi]EAN83986.1 hypothetical protein Tc00.1047053510701.20 [Trypanosoma cruzi]RNC40124.1 hypothetical protein TcCL_NonESM10428 [Trypanosoma cruzi]|eukprot:XP_805837.1 hypothetical protein [Trypanosoma cruzi strain CL Brener]